MRIPKNSLNYALSCEPTFWLAAVTSSELEKNSIARLPFVLSLISRSHKISYHGDGIFYGLSLEHGQMKTTMSNLVRIKTKGHRA